MRSIESLNEDIALVEKYKDIYGALYLTEVCGHSFVWREVTRKEVRKLNFYFPDHMEREEQLCRLCVLDPVGFDFESCEAGVVTTLANQILYESGYYPDGDKVPKLLQKYRAKANTYEGYVDAVITEAFPNITLEEIDTWTTEKIIKYLAMAEYKLVTFRGMDLKDVDDGDIQGDPADFPELRRGF